MNDLRVGDVCITQNGRTRICEGLLVVISTIDNTRPDEPYRIRRVDGHPFPVCARGNRLVFGNFASVWAKRHHLRKPDLDGGGWTDQEAIEQLQMQRAMEAAVLHR